MVAQCLDPRRAPAPRRHDDMHGDLRRLPARKRDFECAATSYSSGRALDTIRSHASILNGFMNSTFGLPFGM